MTPREKSEAFTSLRIIGKKAQKLLARAKQGSREQKKSLPPPPSEPAAEEVLVHLSIRSIVKSTFAILAITIGVLLAYFLQDKLILLLLAIFIAAVLDPGVNNMRRWGIPRGVAILAQYFVALFLILFLLVSLIPIISVQLQQIALFMSQEVNAFLVDPTISLPLLTDEVNARLTLLIQTTLQDLSINQFTDALTQFGQNLSTAAQGSLRFLAQIAGSVVNFFVNLVIVLVLAFFIQIEKEKILSWLRGFLPVRLRPYVDAKTEAIHIKIGQWARGQLLLCLSIGCLVFLALIILRMPYALTLAILEGFTEFIPVVCPFIAAVPAVLIAITQEGFIWALVLAAVYYIIQWCENNLLVPLIMKRAVGLSPVAIIFAMLIGISFPTIIHPVLGIILSIPTTTIIALFLEDWRESRVRK
ncbi:MAG TPA: AI-2E family transporter [Candidatus Peribacteraceae bacterium]|nr:AI-2E family transporter [Candidatus Peribacteraceae bacterium]